MAFFLITWGLGDSGQDGPGSHFRHKEGHERGTGTKRKEGDQQNL
jgi:hypothetical protein